MLLLYAERCFHNEEKMESVTITFLTWAEFLELEVERNRANEKEARRWRRQEWKRSRGQIRVALCKTTWKRLDYRESRERGGMSYMEMKQARHKRKGGRKGGWGTEGGGRRLQKATDRQIQRFSFLPQHSCLLSQSTPSLPWPNTKLLWSSVWVTQKEVKLSSKTCHPGVHSLMSLKTMDFWSSVTQILMHRL